MRILVVDDQELDRVLLREVLASEHHEVIEAADGVEALLVLERESVDAVISDVLMPRMDGFMLCCKIRAHERLHSLPHIFLTGAYDAPSDEKLAALVGTDRYMLKPAAPAALFAVLRELTAAGRKHAVRRDEPPSELGVMREYNANLVRKLGEKNAELVGKLEQLVAAEQQLRLQSTALANAADAIVITDRQGRILWANPAFTSITGYAVQEVIGRNPRLLKSGVHPPEFYRELWETILAGRIWRGEFTNRTKSGTFFSGAQAIAPVHGANGEITHFVGIMNDVTARNAVEAERHESEERYRLMFESHPHPMWVYDCATLRFLTVNQAAVRHYGYSREEFLALTLRDIRPPDTVPRLLRDLKGEKELLPGGALWKHQKKDGTIIDVEIAAEEITFAGRPGRLVLAVDVTARKQAEEALDRERTLMRTLIDQIPDYIYVKDLEGRFVLANEAVARVMGAARPAELLGRTDHNFFPAPVAAKFRADEQAVLAGQPLVNQEESTQVADGTWRTVLTTKLPLRDAAGRIVSVVGVGRDVTERVRALQALQAAEKKYREIFERSLDGLYQTTPDGHILSANPALARILGYATPAELMAGGTDIVREGYVRPEQREEFKRLMAESGEVADFQYEVRRKDGRIIWVSETARSVCAPDGTLLYYEGSLTDITEKKKLETELLRTQRVESIGRLAGGIAHDMNNILAPIMMSAPLLRMALPRADIERTLATIESSAKRGADLVKQLLMFSRGIEGDRGPVAPGTLIREIARIAEETFPKNIAIVVAVEPDVWSMRGDVSQLHQVLLNLFVNARDAMPQGGTLRVTAANVDLPSGAAALPADEQSGPYVRINVSDTGVGIPPEIAERIFEPFFTTKEVGRGTGLGLSTVLGVVKSHGGFIRLTSEPDQGTTFEIHLPAIPGVDETRAAAVAPPPPPGANELVLVVDDEESIRGVLRDILARFRYRVITASDGAEASVVFARHAAEVKLVITDLDMPFMDGVGLVKVLRSIRQDVRIVISSGVGATRMGEARLAELKALGVKTVLHKPYTTGEVLAAVSEGLAG